MKKETIMEREKLVDLVTRAQNGDGAAFEDLYVHFHKKVYHFARITVKDTDLACDIVQDAFLEAIRNIGKLQEPAAFVTWLQTITYHQCTRYFRKKKDVLVTENEDGDTIFDTLADESEDYLPAEVYENKEFRQTIMDMMNGLSEEQRSAALLRYYERISVAQIAEIQGVSEGTVKSRLNYARKGMRKSVEEYEKKTGTKLHSLAFLPLFGLFFNQEAIMPTAQMLQIQAMVAESAAAVGGAGGSTAAVASTAVKATAAKAGAGFGAKLAAMPIVTKIVAGVVAAAIAIGGGTLALHSCDDWNRDCRCDICRSEIHYGAPGVEHNLSCVECDAPIGIIDMDGDHLCDECGEFDCGDSHGMEHMDRNRDDACDMCSSAMHTYADANGDNCCDDCGMWPCAPPNCNAETLVDYKHRGEHTDANGDHICDICYCFDHHCEDNDGDCGCDICGAGFHHVDDFCWCCDGNGTLGHDVFCNQCGTSLGFKGESTCEVCGEYPCGDFHGYWHWDDGSGNCGWCGEPMSVVAPM